MRHAKVIGCLGVTALLAMGCSEDGGGLKPIPVGATATSTPGTQANVAEKPSESAPSVSTTVAPPTPIVVTPDKAEALLLSADDVGRLVGATLTYQSKWSRPDVSEGPSKCSAFEGVDSDSLGQEWTTYRGVAYSETEDKFDHYVSQQVVLYPDAKTAASSFQAAYPAGLDACNGSTAKVGKADWRVSATPFDAGSGVVRWSMEQLQDGQPSGWRCFKEYRNKNNVWYGGGLCQSGNGAPALTGIVDRMAEWIPA